MSLVVGIDIGTQGIRRLAYDPARRHVVATASARPHRDPNRSRPVAHYRRFLRHFDAVTPLYT